MKISAGLVAAGLAGEEFLIDGVESFGKGFFAGHEFGVTEVVLAPLIDADSKNYQQGAEGQ